MEIVTFKDGNWSLNPTESVVTDRWGGLRGLSSTMPRVGCIALAHWPTESESERERKRERERTRKTIIRESERKTID